MILGNAKSNPWRKVTEDRLEDRSVRSYEEICGTFNSNGGRRPQRSTSTTVNGDCTTFRQRHVWRERLDGRHRDGDRRRNTSLVVGVVWRQKSTKLWALSRWLSHIRTLAKLHLETFFGNSQPVFVTVEFINCLNSRTYITENIELIFNSVVCFEEGLNSISSSLDNRWLRH